MTYMLMSYTFSLSYVIMHMLVRILMKSNNELC